jgi:PhnB protein
MPRRTKSRKKSSRGKTAARRIAPIPPGFRTVTPYLAVSGGVAALEFYKKAFGAKELMRQTTPDGKVVHARLKIGDSIVMLSDLFETQVGTTANNVTLHIYSKDVDKLWQQATAAGAKVRSQLDDMYWGERYGQLVDPFGQRWSLSMQVKMSKEEKQRKEKEAMAMFAQSHPAAQNPPSAV